MEGKKKGPPSTDARAPETAGKQPRRPVSKGWPNLSNVMELLNISCRISVSGDGERRSRSSDGDSASSASASDGSSLSEADGENRTNPPLPSTAAADSEKLRMFVGTWNVGGRAPHAGLNLRDWLCTPAPADIYVLGFQEVVPLNAGNILVGEDRGPADTWLRLIGQALNAPEMASTSAGSDVHPDQFRRPRVSFSDLISIEDMLEEGDKVKQGGAVGDLTGNSEGGSDIATARGRRRGASCSYRAVASKQMVGIFMCVWIRTDLVPHVRRTKISCVARGMMGYTGNKGSISISMTLRQTTFCFVCTHLASGEKEKDEARRNSDVAEITKRTRFARSKPNTVPQALAPRTILQHSKVIWLGDLNYRLTSTCDIASELLQKNDWSALLEKDQLRMERKAGRIFNGWEEGRIYFPPTYKYVTNSDRYAVQTIQTREKRRTPAWCDRILWRGEDMKQVCYVRGESRFSDHRPVYSIFSVRVSKADEVQDTQDRGLGATEIQSNNQRNNIRKKQFKIGWSVGAGHRSSPSNDSSNSCCGANSSSRVQAEEMFPITRKESCDEIS